MLFLFKGSGDRSSHVTCRPTMVNPVLYRLFTDVLRRRIQAWVERERVLGELQQGFCQVLRLEDSLSVLIQCTELTTGQGRELWAAFLNVEKACDCIEMEPYGIGLALKGCPNR